MDKIGYDYNPQENVNAQEIKESIKASIDSKIDLTGVEVFKMFIRQVQLRNIDTRWQNHLEELEDLRSSVALRTYAQKNPLTEYKLEGFEIFDNMIDQIKRSLAKTIINGQVKNNGQSNNRTYKTTETHRQSMQFADMAASQQHEARTSANDHAQASVQVVRSTPKVGRNDPCPCGSGKKYKNCCGKNLGNN